LFFFYFVHHLHLDLPCFVASEVVDGLMIFEFEFLLLVTVQGEPMMKVVCCKCANDAVMLMVQACIERECYPSPLNYYNFPKSCCT